MDEVRGGGMNEQTREFAISISSEYKFEWKDQPAQEPDVEVVDGQIFNSKLPIGFTGGLYTHPAPAQQAQEPVTIELGNRGSAFDMTGTKRAYTYKHQPSNSVASKLGKATYEATKKFNPDNVDTGLILLRELYEQGFGVFNIGAEYTHPAPAQPAQELKYLYLDHETELQELGIKPVQTMPDGTIKPVFAPAREPLSYDAVAKLTNAYLDIPNPYEKGSLMMLIREIEKAHGIGGNND